MEIEVNGTIWTKEKLIQSFYFNDASGNLFEFSYAGIDINSTEYYKRMNPKRLMPNKSEEFQLHFSLLLPTFNKETFDTQYEFEFVDDEDGLHYCICSNIIHKLCRFICLKTNMIFQVGNCCIKKELEKLGVIDKYKQRKKEHNKKVKIQKLILEQEKDIEGNFQDLNSLFQEQDEIEAVYEWNQELIRINKEIEKLERIKIYNIQRISEMYHLMFHKPCEVCKLYLLKKEDWKTKCKQCYYK